MKSVIAAAIVLASATLASTVAEAQTPGTPLQTYPLQPYPLQTYPLQPYPLQPCTARVVNSEELPFAPIESWLVKVTLEVTPKNGSAYITTLQDRMPWQGPPPRRGQAFRVWCDPANPGHLQLASRAAR